MKTINFSSGTCVAAGRGVDRDVGEVVSVHAAGEGGGRGMVAMTEPWAVVAWESGSTTPAALSDLEVAT